MNEKFWKKYPPIPGFDCLKMKDEIQAKIYEEIKDLSREERIAYFNRAGERLRRRGLLVTQRSQAKRAKKIANG